MVKSNSLTRLLSDGENHTTEAQSLTDLEWEEVFAVAQRANLFLLLAYQISQAGWALPESLQQIIKERTRQATLHALQKRAELTAVLENLNRAAITPILFKGAVLAHTVYPSYTHRPMGDIDLWVPSEQMVHARTILEALGYRYAEKPHRSHALQSLGDGELQLRGQTALQGLVELHYGVFAGEWMRIATQIDREAVFGRLVPDTVCDQPVLHLAAEDAVVQLALHVGITHQMTVNSLRSLVDLEFLARRGVDWKTVAERCREWRVYTAVSFVIHLWNQILASEQSIQAATALPFHRNRLLRFFVGPADLIEGHELNRSRWRLLYQLCLIDRGRDAMRLLLHTLWPDRSWLQARYGDTRPQIRLLHWKQVFSGKV